MANSESLLPETPAGITIYKILTVDEWNDFQSDGIFRGNPLDQQDGYIHMSYAEQVNKTIQKFFMGRESEILLVHVNTTLLSFNNDDTELRPERNNPNGDVYPHIYGTIPLSAVITTTTTLDE